MRLAAELATLIGIVPLVWLILSRRLYDPSAWWIALAFGVSWVTDMAARWVDPWVLSVVYPVSQGALLALATLPRRRADHFIALLCVAGVASILWHGATGPDLLLRTVAWGGIAGVVWPRRDMGRMRLAILVAFGGGLLAWYGYAAAPGWASWIAYQAVRLAGVLLFSWAVFPKGRTT